MTDVNVAEQQSEQDNTPEAVNWEEKYKELEQMRSEDQKSIAALVAKRDELLKETKSAKEAKRQQEDALKQQQKADQEKNGEYEKLWQQEQLEKQRLLDELTNARKERRDEKINAAATRLAAELAKGDAYKAELLSEFVARSLNKVADDNGNAENEVMQSIKSQFENDAKFAPLLGGNLSAGGGATGNTRSAAVSGEKTRQEFDALGQKQRKEFLSKGGKII